jgi:hypothetical protein
MQKVVWFIRKSSPVEKQHEFYTDLLFKYLLMTVVFEIPLNSLFERGTLIPLFNKEGFGEISLVIFIINQQSGG